MILEILITLAFRNLDLLKSFKYGFKLTRLMCVRFYKPVKPVLSYQFTTGS